MIFAVALGGGIGAGARYLIDKALPHPWGTVTVNFVGSFLLGLLASLFVREDALAGSATWYAMLGAGFCGGLTTFSTFSAEVVFLLQQGRFSWALLNVLVNLLGSFAMTAAAFWLFSHAASR